MAIRPINTAAIPAPPIAQTEMARMALAPWPLIDRYPIVVGQNASLQYAAAVFRTGLTGYRQQYVDLLDELLEKEPHGYSVLFKRIVAIACGQIEFDAAVDTKDPDYKRACEIRDFVRKQVVAIPSLRQHLAFLAWAVYYGLSSLEIYWEKDGDGWKVTRLGDVHSRRLSYPDQMNWDLYIWDQGQVLANRPYGFQPTEKMFGLRVADYPGKFIVHCPQVRGDYPTREGLGRQLGDWFILKRVGYRNAGQYLERFAKPWPFAAYATTESGIPRPATEEDINDADGAMTQMANGGLASYTHPDTIKPSMVTPEAGGTAKITFEQWLNYCNAEISKATVGNTLTTEVGHSGGNRALGEVQADEQIAWFKYDASGIGETFTRDLCFWIVAKNFPGETHLTPPMRIKVGAELTAKGLMGLARDATEMGVPVDIERLQQATGVPVVERDDKDARRTHLMKPIEEGVARMLDEGKNPTEEGLDAAKQISEPKDEKDPEAAAGGMGDGESKDAPVAKDDEGDAPKDTEPKD